METLNNDNLDQALIPATWDKLQKELPDAVNALVMGALGLQPPATSENLPIWYVLTKASGATGIPLSTLYNDPLARQHALAVMATDSAAANKVQMQAVMEQQRMGQAVQQANSEGRQEQQEQ